MRGRAWGTLRDILDTPVSPELLPPENGEISQKTEQIVGPYELHDFFLYHLLRFGTPPSKILRLADTAFAGRFVHEEIRKWLKIFIRRFFSQQYKRSCLPDGPRVGSVALSPRGDWRMPSRRQRGALAGRAGIFIKTAADGDRSAAVFACGAVCFSFDGLSNCANSAGLVSRYFGPFPPFSRRTSML